MAEAVADKGQEKPRVVGLKDIYLDKFLGNELTISTGLPDTIETIEKCPNSENIKLRSYSITYHSPKKVTLEEESCTIVDVYDSEYKALQETLEGRGKW